MTAAARPATLPPGVRTGRIPLWVDLRGVPVNKRLPLWKAIAAAGVEHVLVATDDPHLDRTEAPVLRIDGNNAVKRGKRAIGRLVRLRSGRDQDRAASIPSIVIVESADWTIIPLENLIAARRDRPGTLFAVAHSPEEAVRFRDTLQIGVHGIVLAPTTAADITAADAALRERGPRPDDAVPPPTAANGTTAHAAPSSEFLVAARITRIQDAGPGDRVCVDATSNFRDGEGLLVGSSARSFVLVHAETLQSEYVAARPFRVNAGAVHSYLFAPGGKTRYLSELRAGLNVLAVHPDGVHRVLTVGRAKIEERPHTLVAWQDSDGREGSAVLQTAETIRLVRTDGRPVAVTDLAVGDDVLVHYEHAARHFGMAVEERLEER